MNAIRSMRYWVASGLIGTSSTKQNPWSHFIYVSDSDQEAKIEGAYNMTQPNMKRFIVGHNIIIFDSGTLVWIHNWDERPSMVLTTSFSDFDPLALSNLPQAKWRIWNRIGFSNVKTILRVCIKPSIRVKPQVVIRPCGCVSDGKRVKVMHAISHTWSRPHYHCAQLTLS